MIVEVSKPIAEIYRRIVEELPGVPTPSYDRTMRGRVEQLEWGIPKGVRSASLVVSPDSDSVYFVTAQVEIENDIKVNISLGSKEWESRGISWFMVAMKMVWA